jgi:hypothetical protein
MAPYPQLVFSPWSQTCSRVVYLEPSRKILDENGQICECVGTHPKRL